MSAGHLRDNKKTVGITNTSTTRRVLAVVGLSIGTIAALLLVLVGVQLLSIPVAWLAGHSVAIAAVGVFSVVLAILSVWLWHGRRPAWNRIGLTLDRRTAVQFGAGMGLAGLIAVAGALAVSLLGEAPWNGGEQMTAWLLALPVSLVTALMVQAFPEELLFRGHLQERLTRWLGPMAVVGVSALAFGAIHVISAGPQNAVEQLYLVLQAIAFGFACAATRWYSGTIWIAVGLHGGFHIWRGLLVPAETVVTLTGTVTAIAGYVLVGVLFLRRGRATSTNT